MGGLGVGCVCVVPKSRAEWPDVRMSPAPATKTRAVALIADGIGTPDPNPRHFVNWRFYYNSVSPSFV